MEQTEIDKLKEFMKEYQEIDFNVDLMQKSIISLGEKRDRLLNRLDELKMYEQEFLTAMIGKYGASEITPDKLMKHVNG